MAVNVGGTLGLAVLTAGGLVGGFFLHRLFLVEHCYASDVPGPVPAPASIQGSLCGASDAPVTMIMLAFLAASFVAVVGLVAMWRRARDWVGKLVALMTPVAVLALTWGALTLAPDTCTEEQSDSEPTSRCATHSG